MSIVIIGQVRKKQGDWIIAKKCTALKIDVDKPVPVLTWATNLIDNICVTDGTLHSSTSRML
jgi:hypothetical protein